MRLIDADAEIVKLKDKIKCEKKNIKMYSGSEDSYDKYVCNSAKGRISLLRQKIDFLEKCQTAYDVDKVMEQLHKTQVYLFKGKLPDERICHFSDIIEIVEAGGVNE